MAHRSDVMALSSPCLVVIDFVSVVTPLDSISTAGQTIFCVPMRVKGVFHEAVEFQGYAIRFQRSYNEEKSLYYCVYRRRKGMGPCPGSAQYNTVTKTFTPKIPHNHEPSFCSLMEELGKTEQKKIAAKFGRTTKELNRRLMGMCSTVIGLGTSPPSHPLPAPRSSNSFATFVNDGLAEVKKEQPPAVISPEMEASLQSILSAVSSAESVSPQDPTGSRHQAAIQPSAEEANQMVLNSQEMQQSFAQFSQAIQIQGQKEPLLVAGSSGNRILAKLQEENESLAEQVEVLDKMNNRLGKKVKDLETKVKTYEGTEMEHARRDEELERLRKEDEIKNKTLADLMVKMEELKGQLNQKTTNHHDSEEKLKETTKKLHIEQKKVEFLENEVKNYLTDQPTVENMEIIKSYLHPEMEKYAVEVVKDVFGPRGLRGDAAAAFISKYFDELYGTHWQAILFRSDGHGCLVQHNNNCYILFKLGNYEFLLFRY